MSTPIDQLLAEHRIIEQALRALSGLAARLERGDQVPPEAFPKLFQFLGSFADRRHHSKEEKLLFPALELRGVPRDRGPLGVMLQEHCTGRALMAHMTRAATAYLGGDPNAGRKLAEHARNYVRLLTEHIHKEDDVVFRIARELLDDASLESLGADFERTDADLSQTNATYQQQAEEMERAWAV